MKNLKGIILTIFLVVTLIFVFRYDPNPQTDNTPTSVYENIYVHVVIPEREIEKFSILAVNGQSFEDALDRIVLNKDFSYTKETTSFGSYITSVQGVVADPEKQFWNIKVNGIDASQGISDIDPNNNDVFTLTLTEF